MPSWQGAKSKLNKLCSFRIFCLQCFSVRFKFTKLSPITRTMYHKGYSNFVRPTNIEISPSGFVAPSLDGQTAKKLYLEEVGNVKSSGQLRFDKEKFKSKEVTHKRKKKGDTELELSNQQLFQCAQNNDVDRLRQALDICPDKINTVDEFGWSLLMIACQANSVETVKELLNRGIDTTVRDKAGNSANSLVIKNKNITIADLLLNISRQTNISNSTIKSKRKRLKEEYICEICDNRLFEDKQEHLSSTVHNINASKGKKIPTNYVIPESNRGYQIMLKVGWDKETGLGPDGSGKKYPIKTVQKNDKKGLGHNKVKKVEQSKTETQRQINKNMLYKEQDRNRRMEINFRREFY